MTIGVTELAWGLGATLVLAAVGASAAPEAGLDAEASAATATLKGKHPAEAERIERGVAQMRRYWRDEDGDAAAFRAFVEAEFLPRGEGLDQAFERLEFALERLGGYFNSLHRDLRRGMDLEIGPKLPLDERLAAFDAGAHLSDDLFQNKLAFVVLLNFPLTTLEQRLAEGGSWSRRQWAEARLAQGFSTRVPAAVNARLTQAYSAAHTYIAAYNIYTHHLLTADGQRLFPEGQRLLSHWNLRDEIKARYADPQGLARQRLLARVMEAIVRQEIPGAVVDNPLLDWTPETGQVAASTVKDVEAPAGATAEPRRERENDERYRRWLGIFQAERAADPHHPDHPTFLVRRFARDREIPEAEEALLLSILDAPVGARLARYRIKRAQRPLEPFDIWYSGFRRQGSQDESALDEMTRRRYPDAAAYAADMPRMLTALGFAPERAKFLADHIVVEPARGSGHALGAARRDDAAHLRTRIGAGGMDYKGYNIAVHEMGHNVEQVFSTTTIDHTLLMGVPNTAFTEALAFVFQERDRELLGLGRPDPQAARLALFDEFWGTREIAGVALVDLKVWRWLYAHPEATPAQFREAVVTIAQDVWNRHYANLLGRRDVPLLAIYSHMVDYGLYTPDYPLGLLIAFQVKAHFRKLASPMGPEFERICQLGSITPNAWMQAAVGGPLSAEPMLQAVAAALDDEQRGR